MKEITIEELLSIPQEKSPWDEFELVEEQESALPPQQQPSALAYSPYGMPLPEPQQVAPSKPGYLTPQPTTSIDELWTGIGQDAPPVLAEYPPQATMQAAPANSPQVTPEYEMHMRALGAISDDIETRRQYLESNKGKGSLGQQAINALQQVALEGKQRELAGDERGITQSLVDLPSDPRSFSSLVPFVGNTITDIADSKAQKRIADGTATQEDYIRLAEKQVHEQQPTTFAGGMVDIASQMVGYAPEIAIMPTKAVGTPVAAGVRKVLEKQIGKRSSDIVARTIGSIAQAGTQAALVTPLKIAGEAAKENAPDIAENIKYKDWDDPGTLNYGVTADGKSLPESVLRGFGTQAIEIWSERTGDVLKHLPGLKWVNKKQGEYLAKYATANPDSLIAKGLSLSKKAGFHGLVGENFEEEVSKVLRYAATLDENYTPTSLKELAQRSVVFAAPGAAGLGYVGAKSAVAPNLRTDWKERVKEKWGANIEEHEDGTQSVTLKDGRTVFVAHGSENIEVNHGSLWNFITSAEQQHADNPERFEAIQKAKGLWERAELRRKAKDADSSVIYGEDRRAYSILKKSGIRPAGFSYVLSENKEYGLDAVSLIHLADNPSQWDHETMHVVEEMFLTKEERAVLDSLFDKKRRAEDLVHQGWDAKEAKLQANREASEVRANAYDKFVGGRQGLIAGLQERIKEFLAPIIGETPSGVFRKIESGSVWQREPGTVTPINDNPATPEVEVSPPIEPPPASTPVQSPVGETLSEGILSQDPNVALEQIIQARAAQLAQQGIAPERAVDQAITEATQQEGIQNVPDVPPVPESQGGTIQPQTQGEPVPAVPVSPMPEVTPEAATGQGDTPGVQGAAVDTKQQEREAFLQQEREQAEQARQAARESIKDDVQALDMLDAGFSELDSLMGIETEPAPEQDTTPKRSFPRSKLLAEMTRKELLDEAEQRGAKTYAQERQKQGLVWKSTNDIRNILLHMDNSNVAFNERIEDVAEHLQEFQKEVRKVGILIPPLRDGKRSANMEDFGGNTGRNGRPLGLARHFRNWDPRRKQFPRSWDQWLMRAEEYGIIPSAGDADISVLQDLMMRNPRTVNELQQSLDDYLAKENAPVEDNTEDTGGFPWEQEGYEEDDPFGDNEIQFSTSDPQLIAERDLLLKRAGGNRDHAWRMYEASVSSAKRRGESVDERRADAMRKLLLGEGEQDDLFGAAPKPEPKRKAVQVDRPVQQSLEGLDDGMLFSTFKDEQEYRKAIADAPHDKFGSTERINWGTSRGQGKRSGGTVMGSMGENVRGERGYYNIFGKLPKEEQEDAGGLKYNATIQYAKARAAGLDHDHAMVVAYETEDPSINSYEWGINRAKGEQGMLFSTAEDDEGYTRFVKGYESVFRSLSAAGKTAVQIENLVLAKYGDKIQPWLDRYKTEREEKQAVKPTKKRDTRQEIYKWAKLNLEIDGDNIVFTPEGKRLNEEYGQDILDAGGTQVGYDKYRLPKSKEQAFQAALHERRTVADLERESRSTADRDRRERLRTEWLEGHPGHYRRLPDDDARGLVGRGTHTLIRLGEKFGIPKIATDEQIADIGHTVHGYEQRNPVMLLSNPAGSGKTFILGGVVKELSDKDPTLQFVWYTNNTDLVAQAKRDLKEYGIVDKIEFRTYADLSKGATDATNKILIFDEAHNIKNVDGAERGIEGAKMLAKARFVVMSSATPFESPLQVKYLADTLIFRDVEFERQTKDHETVVDTGFDAWAQLHGALAFEKKDGTIKLAWPITGNPAAARDARKWFVDRGLMSQRPMHIMADMSEVNMRKIKTQPEIRSLFNRVQAAIANTSGAPGIMRQVTNMNKRILEAAKVDAAIELAKEHLKEGRSVILFTETKADRHIGRFRMSGDTKGPLYAYPQMEAMYNEWKALKAMNPDEDAGPPPFNTDIMEMASAFYDAGIDYLLPSVPKKIFEALKEYGVGIYTGEVSKGRATKAKNEFMSGSKRVFVATMAKGGTGLSLHDMVGSRPRAQLNINLPWTGTVVDQVMFRSVRYGMKSKAFVDWLFADDILFEKETLAPRIGKRLKDMGAIVQGEVSKVAEVLDGDFEFKTVVDATGKSDMKFSTKKDDPRKGLSEVNWKDAEDKYGARYKFPRNDRYYQREKPADWKERPFYSPGNPAVDKAKREWLKANKKATEARINWDSYAYNPQERKKKTVSYNSDFTGAGSRQDIKKETDARSLEKLQYQEDEAYNDYANALIDNGMRYSTRSPEQLEHVAAKNGYEYAAFHGSPSKGFTTFTPQESRFGVTWMAKDAELSENYTRDKITGENTGEVRGFFVDIGKDAIVVDAKGNKWNHIPHPTKPGVFTFTDGIAYKAKQAGKTGVIIHNVKDGDNVPRTIYGVFAPENIKSADDVTFDDAGNEIPLDKRFDRGNADLRYSTVGEKGMGAVPQEVLDMDKKGRNRTAIWKQTGWWKGHDGKWRFEIDDSTMKLRGKNEYGEYRGTLREVLRYQKLFDAYSDQFNDVLVSIDISPDNKNTGVFNEGYPADDTYAGRQPEITIQAKTEKDARAILAHELQHAIQEKEDFTNGSNQRVFKRQALKEQMDYLEKIDYINDQMKESLRGNDSDKYIELMKERDTLQNKMKEKRLWDDEEINADSFNKYRRNAGEVEARVTQRRLDMTPEQRKAEPPWVTEEKMLREEGLLTGTQTPEDVVLFSTSQTDTPAFKRWFGDSKVVDEEGRPLVVYHGRASSEPVNEFKRKYSRLVPGATRLGHFFTPSSKSAGFYSQGNYGQQIMAVYVSLKNPAFVTRRCFVDSEQEGNALREYLLNNGYDGIIYDAIDSVTEDYYATQEKEIYNLLHQVRHTGLKDTTGFSKPKGKPKLWESQVEIVALHPTQIKSATGNSGEFDGGNPDIRYSTTDTTPRPIPLPELARLTVDMLGSQPEIRRQMGRKRGLFQATATVGGIKLKADIFIGPDIHHAFSKVKPTQKQIEAHKKDMIRKHEVDEQDIVIRTTRQRDGWVTSTYRRDHDYAGYILAHEIGHADDWLPDKDMKRGNLLGRIAKLKEYLKTTLAPSGETDDALTTEDRKRLRKEAKGDKAAYAKLVQEEMKSRGLFALNDMGQPGGEIVPGIRTELVALSKWWRGDFDEKGTDHHNKYRNSGEELYADAISVLLNTPDAVEQMAPQFWEAMQNFREKHTPFNELYEQILSDLHNGLTPEQRYQRDLEMMGRDGDIRNKAIVERDKDKPSRSAWKSTVHLLADVTTYLPTVEARQSVKDINYLAGKLTQFQRDIRDRVVKPLEDANISWEQFGTYLMRRRAAGERQDMANPGLVRGKDAQAILDTMKAELGDSAWDSLELAAKAFTRTRKKHIMPKLRESRLFTEELLDQIENNDDYATFKVVDFFGEENSGWKSGSVNLIKAQHGTAKDVMNPFFETINKDIQLLWAAQMNKSKRVMADQMQRYDSKNIQSAETRWNGKTQAPVPPGKEGWGLVTYAEDGKVKGVYVRSEIADLFEAKGEDAGILWDGFEFGTSMLKSMFTANNPLFSLWNIQRDVRSTLANIPTKGIVNEAILAPDLALSYLKTIPDAFKQAFLKQSTPLMRELLEGGLVIADRQWTAKDKQAINEYERMQAEFDLSSKKQERFYQTAARWIFHDFNQMVEVWSKLAGAEYMQRKGLTDQYDMRDIMRGIVGSPDFLTKGRVTRYTNAIFLYSNAQIQGLESAQRAFRMQPAKYIMRRVMYSLLPSLALIYMQFGDDDDDDEIKDYRSAVRAIPEYEKNRMICLPVSWAGKAVSWIPMPLDHIGELMHTVLWNAVASKDPNWTKRIMSAVGGAVPLEPGSLNPLIDVGRAAFQYMIGQNPYDMFRGRPAIDETIFRAGGFRSAEEMGKWMWNQTAGSTLGRFNYTFSTKPTTSADMPLVSPAMRRFVRTSDRGAFEQDYFEEQATDKDRAKILVQAKDFASEFIRNADDPKAATARKAWTAFKPDAPAGYEYSDFKRIYDNLYEKRWPKK